MNGCVGSVNGSGVQLDIFISDECFNECSIISIVCFLSVNIDLDFKQNVWPILYYWGMEKRNAIMKCIIYTKLD